MNSIHHHVQHGVCVLTLHRPDKYNAFNREMALALQAALKKAHEDDSVRAVILTGAGKAFCSGQDLGEATDPQGVGLDTILAEHYNPLVRLMRSVMKPIVVAVNGVAAGAGANLALTGDIVLASEHASFIQAFANIGLVPDTGGTWTLPRLVGPGRASAWMMLGDKISALEAQQSGMIYRVCSADTLMEEAMQIALRLAQAPTRAFALTKQALNASMFEGLDAQLELERKLQNVAGESHDFKEGVLAFLEKRRPNFLGK
ncbi:MAG: 2-(1,2-epoxy-1,2-dihydrophenyl)acetyl-CoA isomerase [Flavobacteriia bacterium]|nr:2-(1,2-epoxy-1,2-dihydrophenyl)acetyl-CoA isomerase [Flavobacteriia bacterium]